MQQLKESYKAIPPDENGFVAYSDEDHQVWKILIGRQVEILKNRACEEYLRGLEILNLPADRIPQCDEISEVLRAHTGWSLEPVPSVIPLQQFFQLLAQRKFPVATFIRRREDLDYIEEPDVFHEIFGHCPLLMNARYADFVQAYGQLCLKASPELRRYLGKLYFFTVEVGLIQTAQGLRIFGGGILSSPGESVFALESPDAQRLQLDPALIADSSFGLETMQNKYFVIESFDELFDLVDFS